MPRNYRKYAKNIAYATGKVARFAKDVRYLKSVINVERKFIDKSAGITVDDSGTFVSLPLASQGVGASNREGDSIKVVSLLIRLSWAISQSATSSGLRTIVVIDKQPNGALPSIASLLQTTNFPLSSPLNLDNKRRFKILCDRVQVASITGKQQFVLNKYLKTQTHVRYGSNAGTVADVNTNNIFVLLISDEATNLPIVDYYFRTRYIDN